VEQEVNKIIKQKQKFERMVVTKEEALELFADNPFKVEILTTKVADGTRTTVYKSGDLIDLCRGPHLAHTGKVKAFAATRHSATNWLGDTDNDSLQRMYGISFPDKKQLKVWKENMEKVRRRSSSVSKEHTSRWGNDEKPYNLILGKYMTDKHNHLADSAEHPKDFFVVIVKEWSRFSHFFPLF
jgi:threonyl-tRNA synthetase